MKCFFRRFGNLQRPSSCLHHAFINKSSFIDEGIRRLLKRLMKHFMLASVYGQNFSNCIILFGHAVPSHCTLTHTHLHNAILSLTAQSVTKHTCGMHNAAYYWVANQWQCVVRDTRCSTEATDYTVYSNSHTHMVTHSCTCIVMC